MEGYWNASHSNEANTTDESPHARSSDNEDHDTDDDDDSKSVLSQFDLHRRERIATSTTGWRDELNAYIAYPYEGTVNVDLVDWWYVSTVP
jgi:hypothetical protein